MSAPAGFAGQFGFKTEVTAGSAVTVDQFLPFNSEGLKQDIDRIDSKGIRAGRRTLAAWAAGVKTIGGDVEMELPNRNFATWLKHMFGSVVTSGAGPYTHTATPGDLTGKSLTVQVGKPDVSGTVQPFTYAGAKVASWEIGASVNEYAMLTLTLSAWTEVTATALATASYSSTLSPFTFVGGALTIAGSGVSTVRDFSISGDNKLATDRHRIGSATVKEQLEEGVREYAGTISADFESLTAYNRFVNGTEAALVLAFTSGSDTLTITTNARFDGETPSVGSADELLEQPLPFVCVSSTSDAAAVTCVLVNTETTAA